MERASASCEFRGVDMTAALKPGAAGKAAKTPASRRRDTAATIDKRRKSVRFSLPTAGVPWMLLNPASYKNKVISRL